MAGEIAPLISIDYGDSSDVFSGSHTGTTNSRIQNYLLGIIASLGADRTVQLEWQIPTTLPITGTPKLRILAISNAESGDAKINPKWKSVAVDESADTAPGSMNAETVQTMSWATGDDEKIKELKVTLDADAIIAGEILQMDLVFETSGWTLAQVLTMDVSVIWE